MSESVNYEKIMGNFRRHGFEASFFKTGTEAAGYVASLYSGRAIGFGGSMTLRQIGLFEALSERNLCVWHHRVYSTEVKRMARHCSVYVSSANAVSQTGEIVNIDGDGNRLTMTMFGPEKVYFFVGKNKIAPTLEAAVHRAKNVASPKNALRLGAKTPCAAKGDRCYDCDSPARICRVTFCIPESGLVISIPASSLIIVRIGTALSTVPLRHVFSQGTLQFSQAISGREKDFSSKLRAS